jgi:hypothetical protein
MSSNELPVLSLDEARMNRAAWAESNLQTLDLSIDPIEQLLAPAEGDHLIHASPRSTVIALALKMTFLFPQLAAAKLRTRAPAKGGQSNRHSRRQLFANAAIAASRVAAERIWPRVTGANFPVLGAGMTHSSHFFCWSFACLRGICGKTQARTPYPSAKPMISAIAISSIACGRSFKERPYEERPRIRNR